jgi:hypothetical protein
MPRLSPSGERVVYGIDGQVRVLVNGVTVTVPTPRAGAWSFQGETIVGGGGVDPTTGKFGTLRYHLDTGVLDVLDTAANSNFTGWGGAWHSGTKPIELIGPPPFGLPGAVLYDNSAGAGYGMVTRQGYAVARVNAATSPTGTVFFAPDGSTGPATWPTAIALAANDGWLLLRYPDGRVAFSTDAPTVHRTLLGTPVALAAVGPVVYIVEWQASFSRVILRPIDSVFGWVVSASGHDFYPDVVYATDSLLHVVSSWGAGEHPGELQTYLFNPASTAGQVDLSVPSTPAMPPVTDVAWVGRPAAMAVYCFADVSTPGHYTLPVRPTVPPQDPVAETSYWDGTDIPVDWLLAQPLWRPVGFPCYRIHGEGLDAFKARITTAYHVVTAHGYRPAPVFGLHSGWTSAGRFRTEVEVAEGIVATSHLSDLDATPLACAFAAGRGNLPDGRPDVLPSAWAYFDAYMAGIPSAADWPTPPPDPGPEPPIPPEPPMPTSRKVSIASRVLNTRFGDPDQGFEERPTIDKPLSPKDPWPMTTGLIQGDETYTLQTSPSGAPYLRWPNGNVIAIRKDGGPNNLGGNLAETPWPGDTYEPGRDEKLAKTAQANVYAEAEPPAGRAAVAFALVSL